MTERTKTAKWRVIGESRRGASHVRMGLRNQDAIEYWASESQDTVVLAVADGHGSYTFFRSDSGSRIAVETAVRILRDFTAANRATASTAAILASAKESIPDNLTALWRDAIQDHLLTNPIRPEEWKELTAREGQTGLKRVQDDPVIAYGSTILAVLVAPDFILYVQLGDGDILSVDQTGETRRAVERHDALVANQTHSLCQRQAASEVRISIQDARENPPAMILASTDGYSNSFVTDSDFLMIGQDYLRVIRTEGIDKAEKELVGFLDQTSAEGSGDDVTLGVISRIDAQGVVVPHATAIPHAIDEEELPMAVAAKLTAELEDAQKRIDQLDSTVSSLSARVRNLQIGILVALLLAMASLALAAYRITPSTNRTVTTPPAAARDTGRPPQTPLRLLIGQSAIVLQEGMTLTSEQLGLGGAAQKIAQVRRAGGNAGLELVNLADQLWTVKPADGTSRVIKNGESIALQTGIEIRFGNATARIV